MNFEKTVERAKVYTRDKVDPVKKAKKNPLSPDLPLLMKQHRLIARARNDLDSNQYAEQRTSPTDTETELEQDLASVLDSAAGFVTQFASDLAGEPAALTKRIEQENYDKLVAEYKEEASRSRKRRDASLDQHKAKFHSTYERANLFAHRKGVERSNVFLKNAHWALLAIVEILTILVADFALANWLFSDLGNSLWSKLAVTIEITGLAIIVPLLLGLSGRYKNWNYAKLVSGGEKLASGLGWVMFWIISLPVILAWSFFVMLVRQAKVNVIRLEGDALEFKRMQYDAGVVDIDPAQLEQFSPPSTLQYIWDKVVEGTLFSGLSDNDIAAGILALFVALLAFNFGYRQLFGPVPGLRSVAKNFSDASALYKKTTDEGIKSCRDFAARYQDQITASFNSLSNEFEGLGTKRDALAKLEAQYKALYATVKDLYERHIGIYRDEVSKFKVLNYIEPAYFAAPLKFQKAHVFTFSDIDEGIVLCRSALLSKSDGDSLKGRCQSALTSIQETCEEHVAELLKREAEHENKITIINEEYLSDHVRAAANKGNA